MNHLQQLRNLGQSIWLDYISRDLLHSGELARLVDAGVTGVTSNPTIFQKAVAGSAIYDADIRKLAKTHKTALAIYEVLAVADVMAAADVLRRVYDETRGRDGFVSLEVNPHLADDTEGTVAEARRLYAAVNRPNLMIKVPATPAGLPAITTLIGEGINVNVTLIFDNDIYRGVIDAFLAGLERFEQTRHQTNRPLESVASVASFFVSRIDTIVDDVLNHRINHGEPHLEPLLGKAAVANAKVAYAIYREVFSGPRFAALREQGARAQRPLWASTSTKNPHYPDTKYVDPLIGVNTVNTVPPATLDAIRDHVVTALTIEDSVDEARSVLRELANIKVDMKWVTGGLLTNGVKAFAESFDKLLADIDTKRAKLAAKA